MSSRSSNPLHPSSVKSAAPPSSSSSSSSVVSPVGLSAQGLHELAVQAFRVGNRGRLSLCEALRVLSETRLYFDLGFPSLPAYADTFFQLRRAETFEHVRVARALVELTHLREAFGRGRIGWSALKAITRVATVGSQASWIDFVRENGVERTLAEARDALRHDRDAPRDSSFGLPNLDQKLVLRFSRSDMDKVRTWIESVCARVVEKTGAEEVTVEQAILLLCEEGIHGVSGDEDANGRGANGRSVSCRAQIVYQHCPDCRRARVGTRDGFVEVVPEEVERYEGCADPVVIDGPTPAKLRRRILAREAGRCANPRCHYQGDHCHHIVFRSRGGKTELANEVAVCTTCHALVHAGLLRVSGRADGELRWSPVASDDSLRRTVASEASVADRLPVAQLVAQRANREGRSDGTEESAFADSVPEPAADDRNVVDDLALNLDDLEHGLMRLGVPAARSRRIVDAAVGALPRAELTEANVLRRAVASI